MTKHQDLNDLLNARYSHIFNKPTNLDDADGLSRVEDQIEYDLNDLTQLKTSKANRYKIKYLTELRTEISCARRLLEVKKG